MLFEATTTNALLANVGGVSSTVYDSVGPYLWIAIGVPLAFYLAKKVIGLIPKGR